MFPSITICNLNQLEASFMKDFSAFGNTSLTNLMINEFIKGHQRNLTEVEEKTINEIKARLDLDWHESFLSRSSQACNNLYSSISFRGMNLSWKSINGFWALDSDSGSGPYHFSTDFGSCCYFAPHLNMEPTNKSVEEEYHGLIADALNGEINGLDIVLDAEQFNYAFYDSNAAGFKISIHHHLDKPMIQFSSQLIFTGTETQINLKPSLSWTTDEAISKFAPVERGCFADGEANLTYLPYSYGFHYEMNNCLIDQGIRDIVWNCRCMPNFGNLLQEYWGVIDFCAGRKLHCAKIRMKSLGMETVTLENNIVVPEALENPDMIGNISKPPAIKCMPACKVQNNDNQMSIATFPQKDIFFHQKTFCHVASHIWQRTCQNENRAYFLNKKQPLLCRVLRNFDDFFGQAKLKSSNTVSIL